MPYPNCATDIGDFNSFRKIGWIRIPKLRAYHSTAPHLSYRNNERVAHIPASVSRNPQRMRGKNDGHSLLDCGIQRHKHMLPILYPIEKIIPTYFKLLINFLRRY